MFLPVILVPSAEIIGHLIVLVPSPDALLRRRDAVLVRRNLGHVVTELVSTQNAPLFQTVVAVVSVVESGLGWWCGTGSAGSRTQSGAGRKGAAQSWSCGCRCVTLLGPTGLIKTRFWILMLYREGALQRHRIESVQLLRVELFPQTGATIWEPNLHSSFCKFSFLCKFLSGVHVRILGTTKCSFQCLQLFSGEGGAGSALFTL